MPDVPFSPLALRTLCYGFGAGNPARLIAAKAFGSPGWSDRRIVAMLLARQLRVDRETVSRWRREWNLTVEMAIQAEKELKSGTMPE